MRWIKYNEWIALKIYSYIFDKIHRRKLLYDNYYSMQQLNLQFKEDPRLVEKRQKLLDNWYKILKDEFNKDYMQRISAYLANRYKEAEVYPPKHQIFEAFKQCSYNKTRVVMIGQNPYHTPGTAHGLVFSSLQKKTPPSLKNIFVEIENELGKHTFNHNDLTQWANQGILLLNASLTVERGDPLSHTDIGWDNFLKAAITKLNKHNNQIVYLLWGKFAQSFKPLIDTDKHIVLEAAHPSPFSADRGFFGCGHFKEVKDKYPDIDFNVY